MGLLLPLKCWTSGSKHLLDKDVYMTEECAFMNPLFRIPAASIAVFALSALSPVLALPSPAFLVGIVHDVASGYGKRLVPLQSAPSSTLSLTGGAGSPSLSAA